MRKHVYIEISDLIRYLRFHRALTGIQRVSFHLLVELCSSGGHENIRFIVWNDRKKRHLSYKITGDKCRFTKSVDQDRETLLAQFDSFPEGSSDPPSARLFLRNSHSGWRHLWQRIRLAIADTLDGGKTYESLNIRKRRPFLKIYKGRRLRLVAGDSLFLLGAFWTSSQMDELTMSASQARASISVLIYDLIPVTHPEYIDQQVLNESTRALPKLLKLGVDLVVTISESSKKDLQDYLQREQLKVGAVEVIPIAHEMIVQRKHDQQRVVASQSSAPDAIQAVGSLTLDTVRLPFILCVGTIEGRKNVFQLAQAYEYVLKKHGTGTPRLVFAGKPGLLADDFFDYMSATEYLSGMVRIVDRPNDAELAFLYQHCEFFVYPSYYEGWGLPVGEALWHGRPVIASNTSAIPEVGMDLVHYIDPEDPRSLRDGIELFVTEPNVRDDYAAAALAARASGKLRTWDEVGSDLLSILLSEKVA